MKEKNLQPRILYPARLSFRFDGEIKSFTDKQKLKESSTTKPALQQMLKELLQVEKKRPQLEKENYKIEKLTGKCKHTIKVGNHPHTKLVGKLKDKSSKIICIHNKQLRDTQNRCKI